MERLHGTGSLRSSVGVEYEIAVAQNESSAFIFYLHSRHLYECIRVLQPIMHVHCSLEILTLHTPGLAGGTFKPTGSIRSVDEKAQWKSVQCSMVNSHAGEQEQRTHDSWNLTALPWSSWRLAPACFQECFPGCPCVTRPMDSSASLTKLLIIMLAVSPLEVREGICTMGWGCTINLGSAVKKQLLPHPPPGCKWSYTVFIKQPYLAGFSIRFVAVCQV